MQEPAVSEILGAVLLVSIVITGISIIGVFLMSGPTPEASPKISLYVSCCTNPDGNSHISVLHLGGSPIKWSDITFSSSIG
ncbi:MAG: type IV pilin N-terminal domain-containing protein, partial [Bacteroidota bacterium]